MSDETMILLRSIKIVAYLVVAVGGFVVVASATAFYRLGKLIHLSELMLRKLNNQQPDDDGGR